MLAGLARLLHRRRLGRFFVQPATLSRWHCDLVAKRSTHPHDRPGAAPRFSGLERTNDLHIARARQIVHPLALELDVVTDHLFEDLGKGGHRFSGENLRRLGGIAGELVDFGRTTETVARPTMRIVSSKRNTPEPLTSAVSSG